MESEPTKRQRPVQGRVGAKSKQALAEIIALRKSGARRVDTFEVKEEEPVYDVVDEDQYAQIVKKRRDEGGAFVIDRNGLGYADIGEEVDWSVEGDGEHEDLPTGTAKALAKGRKNKADPAPAPPAQRARMQKMFASAAAKPRAGSRPASHDAAATEALLEDILGGVAAAGCSPSAASPARRARYPGTTSLSLAAAAKVPARAAAASAVVEEEVPQVQPGVRLEDEGLAAGSASEEAAGAEGNSRPEAMEVQEDAEPLMAPSPPADRTEQAGADTPARPGGERRQQAAGLTPAGAGGGIRMPDGAAPPPPTPAASAGAAATPQPGGWRTPAGALPVQPPTPDTAVAAGGWQDMYAAGVDCPSPAPTPAPGDGAVLTGAPTGDAAELPLDSSGALPFYLLDAHEEPAQAGTVFLFGKVPTANGKHASCCAVVHGLQRNLFVVPREDVSTPEIAALEERLESDPGARAALIPLLHAALTRVKEETRALLQAHGVTSMVMKPVLRRYAFENRGVRPGRQWVLKVRYPATCPALPPGLTGAAFAAVFGANQGLLEALTLKRRLMGPGWLALAAPRAVAPSAQLSWCALEVEVAGHKAVAAAPAGVRPAPPLTLASLHVQTALVAGGAAAEIVAASVVYLPEVDVEAAQQDGWRSARDLRHFSAVCRLGGAPFPVGFEAQVKAVNASEVGRRNGGAVLSCQASERSLLAMLVARLRALDVDVLMGHNIAGFDLPILLHRLQHHKVPHWSGLGRLKRHKFPNLAGGGHQFGGGAAPGVLAVLAGRLLCDTYLAARDLVREVDYTLGTLARSLLGEARVDVSPGDVPARYAASDRLLALVRLTESDAWLALGLAFRLSVLPLTRALAQLSGSAWSRSLAGQRAQRIESLLLHEFYARKFLLPDKLSGKERERLEAAAAEEAEGEGDAPAVKKSGKGPQYAGGLVLEPRVGLYDRYVLVLDFNSLYPSIIQEYNICFTTVVRPKDGAVPALPPPSEELAVLPKVLQTLVQRRRTVKDLLKSERDAVRRAQLDIRQQALKLTANSMYGCLGFTHSRFYARPLAELVTAQGREVLQSTVDLVQGALGAEVIYGDTDSIMIHTASTDLEAVTRMGHAIKKEVNKRYRLLEIDVDGVYKRMLLLKKKKYAAIKVEQARGDQAPTESVEQKGLDIVRRDWCPLAKDVGNAVLTEILSGKAREEVVQAVHAHLDDVRLKVEAQAVPLNKFIITKQLTKQPSDYPDAKNQPHVQVALRRLAAGKRDGVAQGETVPYVICDEAADEAHQQVAAPERSLAERAYHPQEVNAAGVSLRPSALYYLSAQVLPVVTRLCAPIEGTDPARLAACLGLDPARYRGAAAAGAAAAGDRDVVLGAGAGLDDDDRFKACPGLELTGNNGTRFRLTGVRDLAAPAARVACDSALLPPDGLGEAVDGGMAVQPLTPAQLSNQAALYSRRSIARYYEGWAASDDALLPCRTRNVCLRLGAEGGTPGSFPPDPKCSGTMRREMDEADLYTELCYAHRMVDVEGALGLLSRKDAAAAAQKLVPLRPALDAAAKVTAGIRDGCAFRWVSLLDLFGQGPVA
ncbi:POLA1 [Auxenochlorella protothecoides x Auxenochlorella symbiontica]